jgi:hypothetical protein
MSPKSFVEMFVEGWAEGSKPRRRTSFIKREKPVRVVTQESNYQWIRVARYIGEDTSLEPKAYTGFWRWLVKRIKQS